MNRAGLDMIDAESLDQVQGKCVYPLVSDEHRDVFKAMAQEVFQGKSQTLEFKMIGLKGRPLWLYTHAVPLRNEQGKIVSALSTTIDITVRKRAEEQLRASEERFQLAMRGANDGLWDWDLSTNEVYYSPPWKSMLGYAEDELEGTLDTWKRLVHPDDQVSTLDLVHDLLEGRSDKFEVEFRMMHKDGSLRHILSRAFLSDTEAGGHKRLVGTHVDITERKRAVEELRTSQRRLAESQQIATIGSWSWDLVNNRLDWSEETFRRFDTDPKTFTPTVQYYVDRIHPEDREAIQIAIQDSLKNDTPYHIQPRIKNESGREWVLEGFGFVERDANGKPLRFAGTAQDITERVQAEEKIRESETFIRSILDTVDEGFIVIDRDYRIMTANKAYCDQTGKPSDEVIGKHCYEISHKTSRPCYEEGEDCVVRKVLATGEQHSALHKHFDKDGHILYVETKAYPIKDSSGSVVSVIETISNITERHLLEEERLKTQKLESIGTLAGGIAHDFNNLLQGIFGYISMAKMTFDQRDKSLEMLEQAEKALHQSVNLTTQLLTFSKGGKPVKKQISIQPVIENAVKFALSGSRSEYRITCAPDLWEVEADEGQLGQVLQNIVLNADQAMPLGGSVMISAQNLPAMDASLPSPLKKSGYVAIAIQDNGVGISEQYLGKIFDPYFTTKEKGSGLGLATSYSIIRNHDGLIEVRSEVGKGTTFLIYLPASTAVKVQSAPAVAPAGSWVGRILVMDDEEIIRMVVGELLNALGHSAEFADKGETALAAYQKARDAGIPFDIVILDLTIRGGMGGEETIKKLREIDPNVKAIVSSGYSDDATMATYREQGFRAILKKPYDSQELQNTLNALLAKGN